MSPTIEHHGGHSRTPANQWWDQVPGRSQRLPPGQPHPPWTPATQRKYTNGGLTLDVDRHYIGGVTATTHQKKRHNDTWIGPLKRFGHIYKCWIFLLFSRINLPVAADPPYFVLVWLTIRTLIFANRLDCFPLHVFFNTWWILSYFPIC